MKIVGDVLTVITYYIIISKFAKNSKIMLSLYTKL